MMLTAKLRLTAAGLLTPLLAAAPVAQTASPAVAAPAPSKGQAPDATMSAESVAALFNVDERMAARIAADIELRAHLHFSTDIDHVAGLRMNPETADPSYPEIPMTREEAAEFAIRQALGPDAETLEATLSEQAAPTFAGLWLDNSTGELVVTTTIGGVEATKDLIAAADLAHPERIRVDVVDHSRRDLLVVQHRLAPVAAKDSEYKPLPYDLHVDVSENALRATFPPNMAPDEQARIEQALAASGLPYRVKIEPRPTPASGTLQDDTEAPPVFAGHGILATDRTASASPYNGMECTMGFKVTRESKPGREYALTAGHCFYNDDESEPPIWYAPVDSKTYYRSVSAPNVIGVQRGYQVVQSYDLALIEYAEATPAKIVVNAATNSYRGIDYMYSSLPEGFMVCAVGAESNDVSCGPIDTWSDGDNRIVADIPGVVKGDSGGPVYAPRPNNMAAAVGITAETDTVNFASIRASNVADDLSAFCGDCSLAGS